MAPTSFNKFCCALVHTCAGLCAACSVYLFVTASIDYVLIALVLFGAAVGFEVVAAVIGTDGSAV
jgi:hypothetical protein